MTRFSAEWPGNHGPEGQAYFVPADSIVADADSKGLAASTLTRDVRSLGAGEFLLFDEPYALIAGDTNVVAHFNEIPELGLSRQRSAQEVAFGQLVASSESQQEAVEHVALKPYHLPRGAVQEAGALHMVNNLNPDRRRPLSFEPLGFYRMPDGKQTALITRYDASVITQDNVFWNPDRAPSEPEVRRAFNHAAIALGGLHAQSLAHHDAQVKNMARDNRGVRLVDLTGLQRMKPAEARADAIGDIGDYTASLTHVDDPHGTGRARAADYTEVLMETFVPAYVALVNDRKSILPHDARLAPRDIEAIARQATA